MTLIHGSETFDLFDLVNHREVDLLSLVLLCWARPIRASSGETKKADVAEHPQAFDHVGLRVNEPPDQPGCSSSSLPTTWIQVHCQSRVPVRTNSTTHVIVPH